MATNVIMPQMGESIAEGTITKWMKKVGEHVDRDEPLFEISTDKVDAEIPSPAAGVLTQILVKENETVAINTVVAVVDGEGAEAAPTPAEAARTHRGRASRRRPAHIAASAPPAPRRQPQRSRKTAKAEDIRTSPLVRRIAREQNVDLSDGKGHGAGRPGQQEGHSGLHRPAPRGRCHRATARRPLLPHRSGAAARRPWRSREQRKLFP